MELVAYGKSDRPEGLFEVVLKFINFLIVDIESTHLLNMQEVHPAVMQLLVHIEYSIKNNMLLNPVTTYETEEDLQEAMEENKNLLLKQSTLRGYIIGFVSTLTSKVRRSPTLANFLFSDSRSGQRQGSYLPLQVLL
jgi:hypothetical protein